jgi:hypothetical protein
MYPKAKAIFDATVIHLNGRKDSNQRYKELKEELNCLLILNEYEVKIPLYHIAESKQNSTNAKALLIQMTDNFPNLYVIFFTIVTFFKI